jgi:hypothetical protein
MFALHSLSMLGDIGELMRRLPAYRAEAEARGNRWSLTNFCGGNLALDALALDDPALARRRTAELLDRWKAPMFLFQHAMQLYGDAIADLYEGDPARALARLDEAAKPLRRSMLLDVQLLRALFAELSGRCALARGDRAGARAAARRLAKERVPWIDALAAGLTALATAADQPEHGAAALTTAEAHATQAGLGLHAQALRRRRAELTGDDATVHTIDDDLRAQGVLRPARLLSIYAPVASTPAGAP